MGNPKETQNTDVIKFLTSRAVVSNAVAGAAADAISSVVLFPLDAIKMRMQVDSSLKFLDIIREGNFEQLYRGIGAKLIAGIQQKFQFFYCYTAFRILYAKRQGKKPGVGADLLLGYFAALQGLGTTLPLEKVTQRIVLANKQKGQKITKDESKIGFIGQFKKIADEEGILSFYNTASASIFLCINPAITYVVFEQLRVLLVRKRKNSILSTFEAFILGAISKAVATVITFPAIRAKVVMNQRKKLKKPVVSDDENLKKPYQSFGLIGTMQGIVKDEGPKGLYAGIYPQLAKGVINAALMLAIKEKVYTAVHYIMTVEK